MGLYLKVLRLGDDFLDYDISATIASAGGSIGRAQGNTLVLPDKEGFVSRTHAKIEAEGDVFFVLDCSSNGTLVLEPIPGDVEESYNEVFVHQAKRQLVDGSYIVIGDFEIQLQYTQQADDPAQASAQLEPIVVESSAPTPSAAIEKQFKPAVFAPPPVEDKITETYESALAGQESVLQDNFSVSELQSVSQPKSVPEPSVVNDIPEVFSMDDFFSDEAEPAPSVVVEDDEDDIFAGFQDPFAGESLVDEGLQPEIPKETEVSTKQTESTAKVEQEQTQNKDIELPVQVEAESAHINEAVVTEQKQAEPVEPDVAVSAKHIEQPVSSRGAGDYQAFFKGLGLDVSKIADDPESVDLLMLNAGKMLRTLVENNISLLQARADLKREFSTAVTTIKREENNPLKFCNSVDEALSYLFIENSPGFLPAQLAVEESVYDLCSHQMAMMAGIQTALKAVVSKFDPTIIEKSCDVGTFNKGSKYWDYYQSNYTKMSKEAQSDFFGADFAGAYERQTRAMKNTR